MVQETIPRGNRTRAIRDHASQMFSHSQCGVHLIGRAKLPFIKPASRMVRKPSIVAVVTLSRWQMRGWRCSRLIEAAHTGSFIEDLCIAIGNLLV